MPTNYSTMDGLAGVSFGKGCDLNISANLSDTTDENIPARIAVYARDHEYYTDATSNNITATEGSEHDKLSKGEELFYKPLMYVGRDVVGDAYASKEDATATTTAVGGVTAGITKGKLLNQTHGSVSEILDLILFPDTEFAVTTVPSAILRTTSNSATLNITDLSEISDVLTYATNNINFTNKAYGVANYATNGNITANLQVYTDDTEGSLVFKKGTANVTSFAYDGATDATPITVTAPLTFIDSNISAGGNWSACSKKGVIVDWNDTTTTVYTSYSKYLNNLTVTASGVSIYVRPEAYLGFAEIENSFASSLNSASEIDADSVLNTLSTIGKKLNRTSTSSKIFGFEQAEMAANFSSADAEYSSSYSKFLFVAVPHGVGFVAWQDSNVSDISSGASFITTPATTTSTKNGVTYDIYVLTANKQNECNYGVTVKLRN